MKKLITLGVLVLVVAGLLVAFFVIKNRPPREPEVSDSPGRVQIDRFEVERVQKMVLEGGGRTLVIERTGEDGWKINSPYDIDLNESKIEDLAYSFSSVYAESVVEEDAQDLSKYGLDEPAQIATGYLDDGSTRVYHLGDKTPTGNTYYLRPADSSTVYAVWMNYGANFSASFMDLRNRKMPQLDYQAIEYLYMRRPGLRDVELQLGPPDWPERIYVFGSWFMSKPYMQLRGVNSEQLEETMGSFGFSEIKGFAEDGVQDLSKYGLDPPKGELILRDAEGAEVHILIGDDLDEYTTYFCYPGSRNVYTLDRYRLDGMRVRSFDLADKFAFLVNIDWVSRVRIRTAEQTHEVRIERTGKDEYGDWISEFTVDGVKIDDEPFRKYYQQLIGVLADGEAETAPTGPAEVTLTFDIAADEETGRPESTVVVEFLEYNRDFYAIRRDGAVDMVTAKRNVETMIEATRSVTSQ